VNVHVLLFCSDSLTSAKTTDISSLLKEIYQVHLLVVNGIF